MAYISVNPTSYTVTDKSQNTVNINYTSDITLTDIKLSTDDGSTYKDKISMTQTNATFDITGMSNNNYTCYLKGFYEEAENGDGGTEGIFNCSITNNLTNCTNTNISTTIYSGNNYSATIVAISNYTISSISVTMGGMDITSSAVSGNNIYIENVSGNIVITATATQQQTGGGDNTQPPTSGSIILNSTNHTINMGEMLTLSATINIDSSYAVFELRQNGTYLVSAYRSGSDIVCYTGGLNAGTYSNLTAVAKTMENSVYVDIAESQPFTLTVNSNSSGGGETTPPDNGGSTPPDNGGGTDSYDDSILSYMYPMPQSHECIPSGAPSDWKYQSRWENKDKPAGWSAFGGWAQIYRVDGTPFTQNTGVEMKNYKVFGWKNGQWHSVVELPYVTGNFYAEDFTDDANTYFANGIKPSDDRSSVIIRLTSDMTVSTSQGAKNVCYHPFTAQLDYDAEFEYIFTCVSMRKVKWDANGVDDMSTSRYCASCGGDWWREKGLTWAPGWVNNKGIAQPKITEVTTDWQVFSMTTVPENWSNGFPK